MISLRKICLLSLAVVCFNICFGDDENISLYKNNEDHAAKKVDANNVPVDPANKLKMIWDNVRFKSVNHSGIPRGGIKKLTIVKFNYIGAWIAWVDEKGYHEITGDRCIPWRSFPEDIRKYYAKHYMPEWKMFKNKTPFTLRTPHFSRNGNELKKKKGAVIRKRSAGGLLCTEISHSIVPFSEFPPEVRQKCGFYQNEAYIPEVPVMIRTEVTFDDPVLFVHPTNIKFKRKLKNGVWMASISLRNEGKTVIKDVFIEPFKGYPRPNHKSDLHVFKESKDEKKCSKCGLSDRLNDRYFNFMFDRQCRTGCSKVTVEYALNKKEDKKIGRLTLPAYELDVEYDKKNPADSKVLMDAVQPAVDEGADGGADGGNAAPEGMPTE